jgi:hypothetical protein
MFSHRHRYEAVAVDHQTGPGVLWSQIIRSTVVLYRCSCTDAWSKTLDGKWTLTQIRGGASPPAGAPPSRPPLTGMPGDPPTPAAQPGQP